MVREETFPPYLLSGMRLFFPDIEELCLNVCATTPGERPTALEFLSQVEGLIADHKRHDVELGASTILLHVKPGSSIAVLHRTLLKIVMTAQRLILYAPSIMWLEDHMQCVVQFQTCPGPDSLSIFADDLRRISGVTYVLYNGIFGRGCDFPDDFVYSPPPYRIGMPLNEEDGSEKIVVVFKRPIVSTKALLAISRCIQSSFTGLAYAPSVSWTNLYSTCHLSFRAGTDSATLATVASNLQQLPSVVSASYDGMNHK